MIQVSFDDMFIHGGVHFFYFMVTETILVTEYQVLQIFWNDYLDLYTLLFRCLFLVVPADIEVDQNVDHKDANERYYCK